MKIIVVALGLVLTQAYSQTSDAGACVFNAPAGWNQTTTRWDGECRDGHADGLGVLKEYQQQTVSAFAAARFYAAKAKALREQLD